MSGSSSDQKYVMQMQQSEGAMGGSSVKEDLPLSTAYNLTPLVEPDTSKKTFMDLHGKAVLVAASGILAAIVTLALIIDIIAGNSAIEPKGVVVSEVPECSQLGARVMREGASVVDGAIVTSLCLSVYLPHRTGPGSGGYMLVKDEKRVIKSFDFMAQTPRDVSYYADASGTSGVDQILIPGMLNGLKKAHSEYGEEQWSKLMETASSVTDDYTVTSSLREALNNFAVNDRTDDFRELFLAPDGTIPQALSNAPMKNLLDKLALQEDESFLDVESSLITSEVPHLTEEDLVNYEVYVEAAPKIQFKDFEIFSSNGPSSGPALLSTLGILFATNDLETGDDLSLQETLHVLLESLKFSSAQQSYVGEGSGDDTSMDAEQVQSAMLNATYADDLSGLIPSDEVFDSESAEGYAEQCLPSDLLKSVDPSLTATPFDVGGVGVVVMNDLGDMAVIVTSLNQPFGSKILSQDGFFYNNFAAAFQEESSTNAIGANKRPASSMAPVLAFQPDNLCQPQVATASSGSVASVAAGAQVMHAILYSNMDIEGASMRGRVFATSVVNQPDSHLPDEAYEYNSTISDAVVSGLEGWGHHFQKEMPLDIVSIARKKNDDVTGSSDARVTSDNSGAYSF